MWDSDNPIDLRFEGLPVFLSYTAYSSAVSLRMSLYDITVILEEGIAPPSPHRKAGIVERCATFRGEWVKVVAVRDFHYATNQECWLVVHVDTTDEP